MTALVLLAALAQAPTAGQAPALASLAASAREAFLNQRFESLFDPRQTVRLELPRRPVGPMVRGSAAAAALLDFTRRTLDREVVIAQAEAVAAGHGLIELVRRYRLTGTGQQQRDRVLLSAVLERGTWRIAEVMVVDAPEPR